MVAGRADAAAFSGRSLRRGQPARHNYADARSAADASQFKTLISLNYFLSDK